MNIQTPRTSSFTAARLNMNTANVPEVVHPTKDVALKTKRLSLLSDAIHSLFELLLYFPLALGIILLATFSLACAATETNSTTSALFITEDASYPIQQASPATATDKYKVIFQHIEHKRLNTSDGEWLARAQLEPIKEFLPEGIASASLIGLYVQSCNSRRWKNIQNTPLALHPKQFTFATTEKPNETPSFNFTPHNYDNHVPFSELSEFECEQDHQLTSHVAIVIRLSQQQCQSPNFIDAIAQAQTLGIYRSGDKVQYQGKEYRCIEGGWCTVGGEYAPAGGRYSSFAWKATRSCTNS